MSDANPITQRGLARRTLPLSLGLRAVQMVVTLIVVKLTYKALSAADFIIFNSVLFALGIASGCFAPSLRAVWRSSSLSTAERAAMVNVVISLVTVSVFLLLNRTLFDAHQGLVAGAIVLAAAVYGAAKAVERMMYAFGFTQHRFRLAFGASFLFLGIELVVVATRSLGSDLVTRLLVPAAASLICFGAYRLIGTQRRVSSFPPFAAVRTFFREEYVTRTGALTVVYSVLFAITGMVERVFPTFIAGDTMSVETAAFRDYLLVLAYGVAFQSLISIGVDWARPRILFENRLQPSARESAAFTSAYLLGACLLGCGLGFPLFRATHLIPASVSLTLWSLLLLRATAGVLLYLAQIDLVISGRLVRAALPWIAIIATQVLLIGGNLSFEHLQRVLILVVGEMLILAVWEGGRMAQRLRPIAE